MKREQTPEDKACRAIMKVAIAMLKIDGYGYLAGKHLACGGWLDVYTYEPLETIVFGVQRVAEAIKPFLVEGASDVWEWRCFAQDGYAEFWSDGSAMKEEFEA